MNRKSSVGSLWGQRGGLVLALAVVVIVPLGLFLPLTHAGLWEPHELEVAEFGRRIAVGLFGDDALRLVGAPNLLPVQRELGRGELPFTSVALGFRIFGLHPWAGRLPLALWAFVGIVASAGLAQRLCDWRAALMTALALSTTPLYFVQAQVMLGYGVAMSGFAVALWGLVESCWSRPSSGRSGPWVWGSVAAAGLVIGGLSAGVLLGAAVPTLAVGMSWLLSRRAEGSGSDRVGGVILGLGLIAALVGLVATLRAIGADYSALAGMTLRIAPTGATHDEVWRLLGHALFPWTGLSVLAFGLLVGGVTARDESSRNPPAAGVLMIAVVLAVGVHGLLAAHAGPSGFVATPAIAIAIGVAYGGVDERRLGSRAMAMVCVALTVIIGVDFRYELGRTSAAFSLGEQLVPESFFRLGRAWVLGATAFCALGTFVALHESSRSGRRPSGVRDYLQWPRTLRSIAGGDLALTLGVLELCLMALALGKAISDRGAHWAFFDGAVGIWGSGVRFGWLLLPGGVLVAPLAAILLRDGGRWLFDGSSVSHARASAPGEPYPTRWRPTRAEGVVLVCGLTGASFGVGFYPKFLEQVSPGGAFAAYKAAAKPSEPLALVGASSLVAPYLVGRDVPAFQSSSEAFAWLVDDRQRHFLIIEDAELPALNFAFRLQSTPPANLPVLDSDSSRILLASNRLLQGEHSANPLDAIVLSRAPTPAHAVAANLNDQLEALGWEIREPGGRLVGAIGPGSTYIIRVFWKVLEPPTQEWTTFVHIDGRGRRCNADHEMLGGRYPMEYWRRGDYLVDAHEFSLEPNFAPGTYQLYFGLFRGSQRLPVKSGEHQADRVVGGGVTVR